MEDTTIKILGYGDAVRILGISHQYLDRLIKANKIPHQRISSGTAFFEGDVRRFQAKRIEKARSDPRVKLRFAY